MLPDEQFASLAKRAVESAKKEFEEKKKIQESQRNYLIDSETEDEFVNKKPKDVTEYYEDVNNMDLSQLIAAELETPLMSDDDDDDDDMSVRKMLMYDETRRMPPQVHHLPNVKKFKQPNVKAIKSFHPPKSKRFKHSSNSTYIPKHKKTEETSQKEQNKSRKQGFKKPKEKLQCLQSIFKERKIPERGVWVQCTRTGCNKWRYLNDVTEPSKIAELWSCEQNSDDAYNSCEKPEADWKSVEKQQGFVDTKFTVGTIVWAKLAGYPWWPAMVEEDPNIGEYFWLVDEWRTAPSDYHVVFLDKNVTRSWINRASIKIFSNPQQHLGVVKVKGKLLAQLQEAKQAAMRAKTLSIQERIAEYGFSSHYTGKWGGADRLLVKEFQKKWPGRGKDAAADELQQGDDSEMSDDSTEEDVDSASSVEQKSETQMAKQRKRKRIQSNDLKIKKSRKEYENTNQENPNCVGKTGREGEKTNIENNCEVNKGKTKDQEEAEDTSKNSENERDLKDEVTNRSGEDTDDNKVRSIVDQDQNELNDENQEIGNGDEKEMHDEIHNEMVDNCQNEEVLNNKRNESVNKEIEDHYNDEKNSGMLKKKKSQSRKTNQETLNKDEGKDRDETESESNVIAMIDEAKLDIANGNTDIETNENCKQKQKKKQRKPKDKSENPNPVEDSSNKVTGDEMTNLEETKPDNEINDNGKVRDGKENQENETNEESGVKAKQKTKKPRKQKDGSETMRPVQQNKESNKTDDNDANNRNKKSVENIKANGKNDAKEKKKKSRKPNTVSENAEQNPIKKDKLKRSKNIATVTEDVKNNDEAAKEKIPIKRLGTKTNKNNIEVKEKDERKPMKLKPTFKAPKKKENTANKPFKPPTVKDVSKNIDEDKKSIHSDDSREQVILHVADESMLENEKKKRAFGVADQNKGESVSLDLPGIPSAEKKEEPDYKDSTKWRPKSDKKNESISDLLKDKGHRKTILRNNENQVVPSADDIDLMEHDTLDSIAGIDAWDQSVTDDITKHDVDQADQDDSQPFEIEE